MAIEQKMAILSSQKASNDALNLLEIKIQRDFQEMNENIKKMEEEVEELPEKTMIGVKNQMKQVD